MQPRPLNFLFILFFCVSRLHAQQSEPDALLKLAKSYHQFMFATEAPKNEIKLVAATGESVETAAAFIAQCITTKNKLATTAFLRLPDEKTLKQLYIVRELSINLGEDESLDSRLLCDSLQRAEISRIELVQNYYEMLFVGVGNKNQPFDLSKLNLTPADYGLKSDTEEGIVILQCFSLCHSNIWGFMNIPKPPNTAKTWENIQKFPKINGLDYYNYAQFSFPDFELVLDKKKGPESYKGYFLNKFFEILIFHVICLGERNAEDEAIQNLLLSSVLRKEALWQYTTYSEMLKGLFQKVEK